MINLTKVALRYNGGNPGFRVNFFSAKTLCTYTMNYLHQEKYLRDHGACLPRAEGKGGRLLMRPHLAFAGSPALPTSCAALFEATGAGTYQGGV
jgi:hypothetical protein